MEKRASTAFSGWKDVELGLIGGFYRKTRFLLTRRT